jgi:hypothetical protein
MSVCHPAGALVVTLRQGAFKGREEGFIESLLTGGYPDPYVVISVLENEDTLAPETVASKVLRAITGREAPVRPEKKTTFARVLDSARSGQKVSYCVRHFAYNHSRDEALEFGVQDITSMSRLARVPTVFSLAGEADGHYHREIITLKCFKYRLLSHLSKPIGSPHLSYPHLLFALLVGQQRLPDMGRVVLHVCEGPCLRCPQLQSHGQGSLLGGRSLGPGGHQCPGAASKRERALSDQQSDST